MKPTHDFAAACLAVGLATAWAGPAHADTIQLTVTPNQTIYDAYFLFGASYINNASVNVFNATITPIGNLTGGVANQLTFTAETPYTPWTDSFSYGVIGLYDVGNQLVTFAFNSGEASLLIDNGYGWAQAGSGYSESAIATALATGDTGTLLNIAGLSDIPLPVPGGYPWPGSGELVNFSTASDGGSVSAAIVVPEPSSLGLLGLGVLGFCARRFRRPSP